MCMCARARVCACHVFIDRESFSLFSRCVHQVPSPLGVLFILQKFDRHLSSLDYHYHLFAPLSSPAIAGTSLPARSYRCHPADVRFNGQTFVVSIHIFSIKC